MMMITMSFNLSQKNRPVRDLTKRSKSPRAMFDQKVKFKTVRRRTGTRDGSSATEQAHETALR